MANDVLKRELRFTGKLGALASEVRPVHSERGGGRMVQ